jgi:hypothetical protein
MRKIKRDDYFILAVFLMDYHAGQWSRGYRLLSKLAPKNISSALIAECQDTELYAYLVEKYREKV